MNPTLEKMIYGFACTISVILAIASIALVSLQARTEARHSQIAAQQGVETKLAVCALRAYYQSQIEQNIAFLNLTLPERIKRYGAIGDLPDTVIRSGLAKERQIVQALGRLNC